MIELPDFAPLKIAETHRPLTRAALDALDHVLVVLGRNVPARGLDKLPQGKQLAVLAARAARRGDDVASSRAANGRATGITVAKFDAASAFAALTWAAKVVRECLRDRPATLGIAFVGLDTDTEHRAAEALVAAAHAAAFALPRFKSKPDPMDRSAPKKLHLHRSQGNLDADAARAKALGNNVARWFTALPPNVLTAESYRQAIAELAGARDIRCRTLREADLDKLGAGAFLAVCRGNATRDAGIVHLSYRPRSRKPALTLVGKGVIFDTGGTNLKPFVHMLDMHTDMQGSAVALGTLLALADLGVPYRVDAWLALTENRLAPNSYKSQDLVRAANGTTIQVVHTDAEGRMVLADTLALAARDEPQVIIDYATLTGACVHALTERYSGVFSNRSAANALLTAAGVASGERVWPFPMDDDFDEALKSDIADVKQCSVENAGDHILAARFLSRFVPAATPWIHVDLSAGQHKGGLGHVPTDITGFGVRLTLELLRGRDPDELATRLSA
ncbi:MAG TPA: leucyl aminopeptidase family protein [Gammaproteobacteria bacterium]|jgi:leucyl aminopeptidase|nr:leucyl aminopeptidase family protein [Gammaproteobacteria bacterium]